LIHPYNKTVFMPLLVTGRWV